MVPLFGRETFFLILRKCYVRQQDRFLVYRIELVEVPVEKNDKDSIKILLRLSKITKLFVYNIQRPYIKYTDLIDDQYIFFFLIYLHPSVDTDRIEHPEPINVCILASV